MMDQEIAAKVTGLNFLSDGQRALVVAAADRIIPAEGNLPGAGRFGVVEAIEAELSAAPIERRRFLDGLAAIDLAAWQSRDRDFLTLDPVDQTRVLTTVEGSHPEFFAFLVNRTYRAYYTNPTVLAALGIDSQPPQPHGYTLPPFDPSRLERVRERRPIYRSIADEG